MNGVAYDSIVCITVDNVMEAYINCKNLRILFIPRPIPSGYSVGMMPQHADYLNLEQVTSVAADYHW